MRGNCSCTTISNFGSRLVRENHTLVVVRPVSILSCRLAPGYPLFCTSILDSLVERRCGYLRKLTLDSRSRPVLFLELLVLLHHYHQFQVLGRKVGGLLALTEAAILP